MRGVCLLCGEKNADFCDCPPAIWPRSFFMNAEALSASVMTVAVVEEFAWGVNRERPDGEHIAVHVR